MISRQEPERKEEGEDEEEEVGGGGGALVGLEDMGEVIPWRGVGGRNKGNFSSEL